jgi:hypothetical protein
MNLKANSIRMGMLAIPSLSPLAPMATGLEMDQVLGFGISLKGSMAWTEVGIS